jgi:hypothetical protein
MLNRVTSSAWNVVQLTPSSKRRIERVSHEIMVCKMLAQEYATGEWCLSLVKEAKLRLTYSVQFADKVSIPLGRRERKWRATERTQELEAQVARRDLRDGLVDACVSMSPKIRGPAISATTLESIPSQ